MDGRLKLLKHPFFLIGIGLYILVQYSRGTNHFLSPFINNYLTDFLCLPLVLIILTTIIRLLQKNANFWPSFEMVLSLTFLFIFIFEIILPNSGTAYTADIGDVVAYILGIALYYLLIDNTLFINGFAK